MYPTKEDSKDRLTTLIKIKDTLYEERKKIEEQEEKINLEINILKQLQFFRSLGE